MFVPYHLLVIIGDRKRSFVYRCFFDDVLRFTRLESHAVEVVDDPRVLCLLLWV